MKSTTLKSMIFACFLLTKTTSFSQQKLIDSLRMQLTVNAGSEKKALLTARLAEAIRYIDLPQSLVLADSSIALAKQFNDPVTTAYVFIACYPVFQKADSIRLLLAAADSAVWYAEKSKDKIVKGVAHTRKGSMLEIVYNDRENAVKEYLVALNYLEGMQSWKYESILYYRLYGCHAEINDLINEEKYARLCLTAALRAQNPDAMCIAWQAIATNFTDHYKANKNELLLDSALFANKQSLEVFKRNEGYIILQSQFAVVALNTAALYFQNIKPFQLDSMRHYLQMAMDAGSKNKNTSVQVNSYTMLSDYLRQQGNMQEAETTLLKAKSIAEGANVKENTILYRLYLSLSEFYEQTGNFKEALQYFKQSKAAFVELNNAQKQADINKLEAQFNIEKQERALSNMTEKAVFRMRQIYLYIGVIILAFAGLIFMFVSYHYRLKYSVQKQKLLENEKEEAVLLSKLKEEERTRLHLEKQDAELRAQLHEEHVKLKTEEAARLEAERKLIQSQKEQLQKELMAGALHLEHKNDMLLNLKDKLQSEQLSGKATIKLNKIINEEIKVDEDFENFKTELKDIHPEFFNRIQQQAKQKLTALDLKYCAYISMKLSTKQMALLLHVEPTSIRMNKYRIKLKIGLAKDEDLENFITGISAT